jgi:DNA helicase-2/ATP-dependent DNA helicase PcrA
MRDYFNKITEELVDPQRLIADGDPLLRALGEAYLRYERTLLTENRVDFAHQQKRDGR